MIVDTSSVIAILFGEPDAEIFARSLMDADTCRISAATFVEISIVIESQAGPQGSRHLDNFLRRAGITVEAVTEEHARLAVQAWLDYGKGRHAAGLNFGDCFSYALAKATDEPLLYKGNDFRRTDIRSAVLS